MELKEPQKDVVGYGCQCGGTHEYRFHCNSFQTHPDIQIKSQADRKTERQI